MTKEFLWNSRKLQEKFNQYSDQKIRWPRNSYEILEMIGNGQPISYNPILSVLLYVNYMFCQADQIHGRRGQ